MTIKMLAEVKINNQDIVTALRKWEVDETFGEEIRDCKINVSNTIYNLIPTLGPGQTITIKRGTTTATDQFVFSGTIDRIDKKGGEVIIYGLDKMAELVRKDVTYSYDGVSFPSTEAKGSDIAKDLIETWGGMTASVVDTGVAIILKKFICRGNDVFERLQKIANIYDYMIYYNPSDDKVHFEPKGYTSNAESLIVGGNVSNLPTWTFDNSQCINKLIVRGAMQEVQDEQLFSGTGGAGQTFTLAKKPIAVQVFDGSTLKTPGVVSSTSGAYDYTIDKETKVITPTSNWTPGAGSNNIKIIYTNAIPVPVQVEDTVSQGKYGICQAQKHFSDIQTVDDAELRGNSWISQYSEPFVEVKVQPPSSIDYEVGQKVRVIDSINDEDREVVINNIKKTYPHKADVLSMGDREWKLAEWGKFTLDRVRRLEEENQRDADLVIQIKTLDHPNIKFNRRYTQVNKKAYDGSGTGIYGNVDHGVYGTATYGSDPMGAETVERIVWPNQVYTETFFDEDFKDTGTGDWDITNKELRL